MRPNFIRIAVATCMLSSIDVVADEPVPASGTAPTSPRPDPAPGVDELLARPTLTRASASVSTKEKDPKFTATFVPAEFIERPYWSPFSELKLSATADTSTSLTRITISTGYNPFARRSDRVANVLRRELTNAGCGARFAEALETATNAHATGLERVKLRAAELEAEALPLDSQAFALEVEAYNHPLATPDDRRKAEELKKRADKARADAAAVRGKVEPLKKKLNADNETAKTEATKALDVCSRGYSRGAWKHINSGWTPAITFSFAYDFFPYGHRPNPDDMSVEDELEWHGGPSGQIALEFRRTERLDLSAWATGEYVRATGEPSTELAQYLGGGVTASATALSLLPDESKDLPDYYVKDGFIPGVALGMLRRC